MKPAEIKKRFEKLNKDSMKYKQGMDKLKSKFGYLSIISPVPKEKLISSTLFLSDRQGDILKLNKFSNEFHNGRCLLNCRKLNILSEGSFYKDLTLEDYNRANILSNEEVKVKIKEYRDKAISLIDNEIKSFKKEVAER